LPPHGRGSAAGWTSGARVLAAVQEGSQVSLKEFRGKWVVLYFYPKDMTQGCTIEAHNFQQDLPKYEQKHAVIVASVWIPRQPQGVLHQREPDVQAALRHG